MCAAGIPLTLRETEHKWVGDKIKYVATEVPVLLVSYDEIEFPGYDLDTDLAARELGFNVEAPQLRFYDKWRRDGFQGMLEGHAPQMYEYLERHGYGSFNFGNFSREIFARELCQNLSKEYPHFVTEKLNIIRDFVDPDDPDAGPISLQAYVDLLLLLVGRNRGHIGRMVPELYEYLIGEEDLLDIESYKDALFEALEKQVEDAGPDIKLLLEHLFEFFSTDEVDYEVSGPYETEMCEWHEQLETTEYNISIDGYPVAKWQTVLQKEIYDPIWYEAMTTDLCEAADEYCTPQGVEELLDVLNLEPHEPDEPDDPWHPESDPEGEIAVLYERYDWVLSGGELHRGEISQRVAVPYADIETAKAAIEFSKHIIKFISEESLWDLSLLERRSPEEIMRRAGLKRQRPLAAWGRHEPDPILDEWRPITVD